MSDESKLEKEELEEKSWDDSPKGSPVFRQVILVVLLIVAAGALAYDLLVARRAQQSAWNRIENLAKSAEEMTTTKQQVEQLIGFEASDVAVLKNEDGSERAHVGTYRWRRGLPFLNYSIQIAYTRIPGDEDLYYYSAVTNGTLDDTRLPIMKKKLNIPTEVPSIKMVGPGGGADNPRRPRNADEAKQDDDASKAAGAQEAPDVGGGARSQRGNANRDKSGSADSAKEGEPKSEAGKTAPDKSQERTGDTKKESSGKEKSAEGKSGEGGGGTQ